MLKLLLLIVQMIFTFASDIYACTIFTVKIKDNIYFCNHEDYWEYGTMLWVRPGDGKKLGAIYYGYKSTQESYRNIFADKPDLMVGDIHPDGGMNEKGLSWDWVADGTVWGTEKDSDKPPYKKSHIFYDIIQKYSTVDEAIDFIKKYKHTGYVGRAIMNDRFGNSVEIYGKGGKIFFEKADKNYQITGYGERTEAKSLLNAGEYKNIKQIAVILDASHQGILNQYSNINDPVNKIIYLFHFQNFEEFIKIDMLHEFLFGEKSYSIPSLFSRIKILPPTIVRKSDSASVTFKWKGKPESIYKLLYSKDKSFSSYKEASINSSAIAIRPMPGSDRPQQDTETMSTFENYKRNLPKFEIKEFSKTIGNMELNTTYYWKVVAHPKGNDHFISESFISSFIADSK